MEKAKSPHSNEWLAAQKALMNAIGFNEDDLDANRGGYMSKKQRATLSRERSGWLNEITIIVVLLAGLFVFLVLSTILSGGQFGTSVMAFGAIALVGGVAALYIGYLRSRLDSDLHKGDVFVVDGAVSLFIDEKQYNQITVYSYYMRVQDQRFKIERSVYDAFTDHEPYAIYYAPFSKKILSVEWIHKRDG
jgi:hypothetical protein